MKITLQYPIKSATGQTISTLELARAKRSDLKAAQRHSKEDAEQEDFLFARLTGLTLEDIDLLDMADSKTLSEVFRKMLDIGSATASAG